MPQSIVWKFFKTKQNNIAECQLCSHTMSYKHKSTSNMFRHLKQKHPIDLVIETEKKKTPALATMHQAATLPSMTSQDVEDKPPVAGPSQSG